MRTRQRAKLVQLAVADVVLWVLAIGADKYLQPCSRRIVNLSYVLWMLAQNVFQLWCALATQLLMAAPDTAPSVLLAAVTAHSLPFFLLCNLLTGAVNLTVHTIYQPPFVAYSVVCVYITLASVICVLAYLARKKTPSHVKQE